MRLPWAHLGSPRPHVSVGLDSRQPTYRRAQWDALLAWLLLLIQTNREMLQSLHSLPHGQSTFATFHEKLPAVITLMKLFVMRWKRLPAAFRVDFSTWHIWASSVKKILLHHTEEILICQTTSRLKKITTVLTFFTADQSSRHVLNTKNQKRSVS